MNNWKKEPNVKFGIDVTERTDRDYKVSLYIYSYITTNPIYIINFDLFELLFTSIIFYLVQFYCDQDRLAGNQRRSYHGHTNRPE